MDHDIVPANVVCHAFGVGRVPADLVPLLDRTAERIPAVLASRAGSGFTLRSTNAFPATRVSCSTTASSAPGPSTPLKARVLQHAHITADTDRARGTAAFDVGRGDLATQVIAETEPVFAEVEIHTGPNEAATLRNDAARLLAEAWMAGQLAANTPPRAWHEDIARLSLTVAARAQVQHETDVDFEPFGENHGDRDGPR